MNTCRRIRNEQKDQKMSLAFGDALCFEVGDVLCFFWISQQQRYRKIKGKSLVADSAAILLPVFSRNPDPKKVSMAS